MDTKTQRWVVLWELDSRDAKLPIHALRLEKATGAETPAEHRSADRQSVESKSKPLSAEFNTKFGSCVMRAAPLALAQDDPTISETVTQLSRRVRAPHEMDYQMLKWEGISGGTPRRRTRSRYGACSTKIRVHVGTDHEGCAVTRRSTAVFVYSFRHCVKYDSSNQLTISLSRGELEWYGLVKGISVGLGLQSLTNHWGSAASLELLSDCSAAKRLAARQGLGRMRHVQTR